MRFLENVLRGLSELLRISPSSIRVALPAHHHHGKYPHWLPLPHNRLHDATLCSLWTHLKILQHWFFHQTHRYQLQIPRCPRKWARFRCFCGFSESRLPGRNSSLPLLLMYFPRRIKYGVFILEESWWGGDFLPVVFWRNSARRYVTAFYPAVIAVKEELNRYGFTPHRNSCSLGPLPGIAVDRISPTGIVA